MSTSHQVLKSTIKPFRETSLSTLRHKHWSGWPTPACELCKPYHFIVRICLVFHPKINFTNKLFGTVLSKICIFFILCHNSCSPYSVFIDPGRWDGTQKGAGHHVGQHGTLCLSTPVWAWVESQAETSVQKDKESDAWGQPVISVSQGGKSNVR